MSATGLDVFDKTVQTTNIWLGEIMEELGPDRQRALHALRAVLHALRDRLTIDEAAQLSAQLPLLVRGIFYESWDPQTPSRERSRDEFIRRVQDGLEGMRPVDPEDAARAVFKVLDGHVTAGEIRHVRDMLPREVQALWP